MDWFNLDGDGDWIRQTLVALFFVGLIVFFFRSILVGLLGRGDKTKSEEGNKLPEQKPPVKAAGSNETIALRTLDEYTWKAGMPAPKKEHFGLDSQVIYRFEGHAQQVFRIVKAISGAIFVAIWFAWFPMTLFLFGLAEWDVGAFVGYGFLGFCGSIFLGRLLAGPFKSVFARKNEGHADMDTDVFDRLYVWVAKHFVSRSLPALLVYEKTYAQYTSFKEQEKTHLADLKAGEVSREAKLRWENEIWRRALTRQQTGKNTFADKDNVRPTANELLQLLESDTGEDLEIVVLGILRAHGWNARLTSKGADGGVDVEGERQGPTGTSKLAAQVKHWKANIPETEVRSFWGATSGVYDEALFVTSSRFNRPAKSFISQRMNLGRTTLSYWEGPELQTQINQMSNKAFSNMVAPLKTRLAMRAQEQTPETYHSDRPDCPKCGSPMEQKENHRDGSAFYGCTRYPGCKGTINIGAAEQAYLDHVGLSYKDATKYVNWGVHYRDLGQYQQALREFSYVIGSDGLVSGLYRNSYSNRGYVYRQLGEYQMAIQDYDEAIRLDPQGTLACWLYSNRGYAYLQLGEYQMAIQDYDEAIRLDPQYPIAYLNRGIAHSKLGRSLEAERDHLKYEELKSR